MSSVSEQKSDQGLRIAVATLIGVDGSSPRPIGSQIGVCEDGSYVGMITGGCAEKAIVAEALECITRKEDKSVRYGEGSPYMDVILPCGSGIDIFISASNTKDIVNFAVSRQAGRNPFWLSLENANVAMAFSADAPNTGDRLFLRRYDPDYRILVFGEGANLIAFVNIASAAGYEVIAHSQDEQTIAYLSSISADCRPIHKSFDFTQLPFDPYTAVVTLFHEHDWEHNILHAALNSDAHYIGALGSKRTHQARLEALRSSAVAKQPLSAIHGPIGINIGSQNPAEIAVSILAEITALRRSVEG